MGACGSKFGAQARQEERLPQPKEDCAGTRDKGGRPSVEVEEKKIVVGESTGEKKEDWSKDETKRRSLSILFKEVFSGILFRESDAADEKKPKDELKKSQDEKPEMAVARDTTGGAAEVEKTEKSIQTDKPKDVEEVTVVAEVNSVKSDEPKATSQDLKKQPEPEPEIKVLPVSEVAASETEQSKVNQAVKEIKDSTPGDDDAKKLTDKL